MHPVTVSRRIGAQSDKQVGLAGARVADQAEGCPLHPFAGRQGVDGGGVNVGVRVEVEGPQPLVPGKLLP